MLNHLSTSFDNNDESLISCYDELPLWSAPFGLKLLEQISYTNTANALDIGFGTGFPLLELAMRLGNNSRVYGIDPWKGALKRARTKVLQAGISNVHLIESTAEHIPLNSNTIDLITSNNGFNNVYDLPAVIKECSRVSKHDAQLIMTMNTDKTMIEFYTLMKSCLIKQCHHDLLSKIDSHIRTKRPPVNDTIALFKENKFKMITLNEHEFSYTFANYSAFMNHYFIRLSFAEAWKRCIPLELQTDLFSDMEREGNQESIKNNGFKVTIPYVVITFCKE
jgi:ubiquinone/menaquinone biosynthesis C-methylase UbiE